MARETSRTVRPACAKRPTGGKHPMEVGSRRLADGKYPARTAGLPHGRRQLDLDQPRGKYPAQPPTTHASPAPKAGPKHLLMPFRWRISGHRPARVRIRCGVSHDEDSPSPSASRARTQVRRTEVCGAAARSAPLRTGRGRRPGTPPGRRPTGNTRSVGRCHRWSSWPSRGERDEEHHGIGSLPRAR
jgi:hypothetical protein